MAGGEREAIDTGGMSAIRRKVDLKTPRATVSKQPRDGIRQLSTFAERLAHHLAVNVECSHA
jgi:hypothetical protein